MQTTIIMPFMLVKWDGGENEIDMKSLESL